MWGEDFSIDRYNAAMQERTKSATAQELLEQYKAGNVIVRAKRWRLSREFNAELTGTILIFFSLTVIREMIKMLYIHNQLHFRDMKKALRD